MKVARIPYLNAAPFHWGWDEDLPFEVVEMVPRALGVAARDGAVDAGLMAVADWFSLDGSFDLVSPAMGVAASRHVRSVILFSHRPPRQLDGGRIGVTGESSTSRRLVQLLAKARWEIDVEWVPEAEFGGDPERTLDAVLLIGDRALEVMSHPDRRGWPLAVDLATEWWDWQKLPFTFAVWVARSSVSRRDRARFSGFLAGSLAVGLSHLDEIATAAANGLGSADVLAEYLGHFDYRLGPAELQGMRRFRDLLADHDIQEYSTAAV